MEDQIGSLERLKIRASKLNASSTKSEVDETQKVDTFFLKNSNSIEIWCFQCDWNICKLGNGWQTIWFKTDLCYTGKIGKEQEVYD